ncbi:FHA domain-containing protein [Ruegeria sp. HKCCD7255]|uniref:FHA domain-containing protein n=1 Tax=Ruegeria sp. HKCCD7255 TaxID=2683004 RepID=UPI001487FAD4|nr:FHA domain-containing protein [Ruegeria sp. HKCCD7255]
MFKYKSPLSRLLEGAGKAKDDDLADVSEVQAEDNSQPEPIADFNALRNALAGGNLGSESYDDADELLPEEKMEEFPEEDLVEEEPAATEIASEDDPVVTLHLTEAQGVSSQEEVMAAVAEATIEVAEEKAEPTPEIENITEVAEIVEQVELEEELSVPEPLAKAPEPTPIPATAPTGDRRSRVKTTFLGFERGDTKVQDLMETAAPVAKTEAAEPTFPVGWLVVTSGPGRGAAVTLTEGLMQIGRNDDQAIQLDFGDTGISRSNHAVIAYDPEDRKCYLGHGGKANLVRLNGKPVLSTIALSSGDLIRISETSLRFAAFCDDGFDWRDTD